MKFILEFDSPEEMTAAVAAMKGEATVDVPLGVILANATGQTIVVVPAEQDGKLLINVHDRTARGEGTQQLAPGDAMVIT